MTFFAIADGVSRDLAALPGATNRSIGIAAALGSAASWALGAVLFKAISERMSPFAMTLAKGAVSVVLLGLVVFGLGFQRVTGEALGLLALSGLIGIALGDSLFFRALGDLGPVAIIVLMMVGQMATALLGVVILGEMPPPQAWAGMALILIGVALVLWSEVSRAPSATRTRGLLFGLGAVLCMAISMIIAKKPLDTVPTIEATFLRMAAGTIGVFAGGAALGRIGGWLTPLGNPKFLAKFLLAVTVVTFGGFWLSILSIKHLHVAIASALNATEPVFAIPLAAILLKERVTSVTILGTIAVALGISLIAYAEPQLETNI